MKKSLIVICLTISNILTPAAATKATTYEKIPSSVGPFFIHNKGTQPFTLNSISVRFKIGTTPSTEYSLTYKKVIKPGKIVKISNAKIKFNEPEGTQVLYSGISEININNNQIIKTSNPLDDDIYLTNQGNVWKEATEPNTITPKGKNISSKITTTKKNNTTAPKSITPAAKTSTVKATTIAMKNNKKMNVPKSKTAKAINTATTPKTAIIKPEIAQQ